MAIRFSRSTLGKLGEWRAALFYLVRGYRVVRMNARFRRGEIDLVVRRGGTLVIVEVKTRQSLGRGEGWESVGGRKRTRLVALAGEFLLHHPAAIRELRYDIVSILWTGWRFEVTHFADAFRPTADERRAWRLTA